MRPSLKIQQNISRLMQKAAADSKVDFEEFFVDSAQLRFWKERERRIEYALRYLIPQPIKGEITAGKIRYRGIYYMVTKEYLGCDIIEDEHCKKFIFKFKLPMICGKESRSGKRRAFELSLDFDERTLLQYKTWCRNSVILKSRAGYHMSKKLMLGDMFSQIQNTK